MNESDAMELRCAIRIVARSLTRSLALTLAPAMGLGESKDGDSGAGGVRGIANPINELQLLEGHRDIVRFLIRIDDQRYGTLAWSCGRARERLTRSIAS